MAYDPDSLLRAAIREAGSPQLALRIRKGLGAAIYSYMLGVLRREQVEDPRAQSEAAFSDFLSKVLNRFRRLGSDDIVAEAWFWSTARSALLDRLLKRARRRKVVVSYDPVLLDVLAGGQALSPARPIDEDELMELIRSIIRKLPARQRDCLLHSLVFNRSTAEIAELMNLKSNSVVTLRYRATKKLRDKLLDAIRESQ